MKPKVTVSPASRQIIERRVWQLHVSASNVQVVRHVYAGLNKKNRRKAEHRDVRKAFYRYALAVHAASCKLYHDVTRGRLA